MCQQLLFGELLKKQEKLSHLCQELLFEKVFRAKGEAQN